MSHTYEIDLSQIEPTVAFPHLPENTRPIAQVGDVTIDQVVIGSCTNGRLEDMAIAAKILEGKKVATNVRCIVMPATQSIYKECIQRGYMHHLHRRRLRRLHPHLRPLPGRSHGCHGQR